MQKREKILAGLVGVTLLVAVGPSVFDTVLQQPLDQRRDKIAKLENDIAKKTRLIDRAKAANRRLQAWEEQSLPTDTARARSAYQNWLLELVENAGFGRPNVDSGEIVNKPGTYAKIPFTVRAQGTLEQLTRFLHAFYSADHLHQIQRLGIMPISHSNDLELSLAIEALVLPGGSRKEQLNRKPSNRLVGTTMDDYEPILRRNLFGEGGASSFDAADYAFLTAILDVNGAPEAWLTLRTTGEVLKLHEGDEFEVGQFRGRIAEVLSQDIVVKSDDERWLLTLGENLSQATALPPEF
ncbi:MAG: hypothetical protein K1X74_02265 [Pirellulales bacterium]|nr:hypothetical protein [Pirellulales bacterium]